MYNEQLEQLIEMALTDGELTEKELMVLRNKAKQLGVDPDEVEMVVAAKLSEKKQRGGAVIKCPSCGEVRNSTDQKCKTCGYIFEDIKSTKTLEALANQLNEIGGDDPYHRNEDAIISNFPLPNSKNELMDLFLFLVPKSENRDDIKTKLKEIVDRVQMTCGDDPEFVNKITTLYKSNKKKNARKTFYIASIFIGFFVIMAIIAAIVELIDKN